MDKKRGAVWFILATILLDAIGIGLIFPIMPDLMERVGAGDTATGAFWGGVLMAGYAGAQFLFSPAMGGISDALGRKPVLLFTLAALAVDYVIMALAGSLWVLLVGRLLAGIAGATYITATAYLADISAPKDRAANFGLIGATFGVGFIIGPAMGGLLAGVHVTAPFWAAAVLAAVNFLFGLAVLPESLPVEKRRRFDRQDLNPFGAILKAARLPGLGLPLIGLFLFEFANMVYPVLWAFWTREAFGWSSALIGLSLAAYGVGVVITQGGLMRIMIPRFGEWPTLMLAVAGGVIASVAYGFISSAWLLWVFLPFACLSDMAPPNATGIASNLVEEDRQGLLQGVIASMSAIAAITAPLIVTPMFKTFASPEAAIYLPGAPFLMTAVLLLLSAVVFWPLRPGKPAPGPV
ncbi:TCR/Tet family MFS transporter [Mameliella sediminis]|uniref:TCR/Tet family MFS transporter n=1 Tax=Mameliella sediminis TaxID=2836866 RepID=UPI001C484427|nr:TCR/Tet family MFS transporter [Mameliella sediminis]MBV7394740.1 TCR/Tet family MFS transporter [Mameliella sediminis]MBY6113442.1 TCR/Tet family MFS transporter [Antarctobacter heliothermus]MBY6143210.1 TCR/Tet family MFS transporter [Mameliella alba]MCA0953066.1 TCR/Tet family MFS transporter [Mameliella alba]